MIISVNQFNAPLRPGLDFVGGTRLRFELDCKQPGNCDRPIDVAKVREVMAKQNLADSSIQLLDKHALEIRTKPLAVDQRTALQSSLTQAIGTFASNQTQIDTVGPTLGRQLFTQGLLALGTAFAVIAIYLGLRFQPDSAVIAIVALFHDVLITVGVFSILGLVRGIEADSLFVVALLTIAGFSVHDTVIIYDRIRENAQLHPDQPINELVDESVQQTLTRSINTVLTVLLMLTSLLLFGGETLKNFALTLIIGFVMGAYSSIFVAGPLLAWWRSRTLVKKF